MNEKKTKKEIGSDKIHKSVAFSIMLAHWMKAWFNENVLNDDAVVGIPYDVCVSDHMRRMHHQLILINNGSSRNTVILICS